MFMFTLHIAKILAESGFLCITRYFAVLGPKLWNSLPYQLNSLELFELFKSRLTTFLLSIVQNYHIYEDDVLPYIDLLKSAM